MIKTVYEHIYTINIYPVDEEVLESYVEKWVTYHAYEEEKLHDA